MKLNLDLTYCDGVSCDVRDNCAAYIGHYENLAKEQWISHMASVDCLENNYDCFMSMKG